MKTIIRMSKLSILAIILILGGCASSQPKLTQEQVFDQYPEISKLDAAKINPRSSKYSEMI